MTKTKSRMDQANGTKKIQKKISKTEKEKKNPLNITQVRPPTQRLPVQAENWFHHPLIVRIGQTRARPKKPIS